MNSPCIACPFRDGDTVQATQAQNWGCLPTSHRMVEMVEEEGVALSCHDDNQKACRGLVEVKPEAASLPVKSYEDWYRNG